eukprot:354647-Chlamydomonas_euryale.AAC.6
MCLSARSAGAPGAHILRSLPTAADGERSSVFVCHKKSCSGALIEAAPTTRAFRSLTLANCCHSASLMWPRLLRPLRRI